jgi:hypothetical protein
MKLHASSAWARSQRALLQPSLRSDGRGPFEPVITQPFTPRTPTRWPYTVAVAADGTVELASTRFPTVDEFGAATAAGDATSMAGDRVRLTALVKTEDVSTNTGLFFRIEGDGGSAILTSHNTILDTDLSGTRDWTEISVTLDVPWEATNFAFGLTLEGIGKVWLKDPRFERVA